MAVQRFQHSGCLAQLSREIVRLTEVDRYAVFCAELDAVGIRQIYARYNVRQRLSVYLL